MEPKTNQGKILNSILLVNAENIPLSNWMLLLCFPTCSNTGTENTCRCPYNAPKMGQMNLTSKTSKMT